MKHKSVPILIILFLSGYTNVIFAQAKVIRTESFDGINFPPFGWSEGKLPGSDINNHTEHVTSGTMPACAPHSGPGMLRYRSGFMFNAGDKCFLASPRYDLTNNPGTATVSFWLYRDNIYPNPDSVTVYINDSANANISYASMTKVLGPFSRAGGSNSWVQYSAVIPTGYNNSNAYLIFVFTNRETSGAGGNLYVDDFSIETYPKPMGLVYSKLFYQSIEDINKGASDQLISGIKVETDGAGDSLKVDSIITNAIGSSTLSDIVSGSVKIWYTKGTGTFVNSGNQFGIGITPTFFRDKFTQPNFYLENGDNYFWVTMSTTASSVSGDCIDLEFPGIFYRRVSYTGADTSSAPLVSTKNGCRQIYPNICGGIIPTLIYGTSGNDYTYKLNDFIKRVYLEGAKSIISSYPHIDNNMNDIGPPMAPWYGGPAPFTAHPPDYQQFSLVPNTLHPDITAVLSQGVTYLSPSLLVGNPVGAGIALQCGTWPSSNYMAAWIDFNNDGDLIDVGEQIVPSTNLNANTWVFASVSVPSVVGTGTYNVVDPSRISFGNVKMRIREVFATNPINPCQSGYTYGETEDYHVSLIPGCVAGVKLWLGYTDDWNSPGNWCGGVPTLTDVALIDEAGYLGGTQSGAPYEPVIHSGTAAQAKTIRISGSDSLIVNAPVSASLQIADSISISYNTPFGGAGLFKVNKSYSDTAQLLNANLQFLISPFQANKKNSRMQLIYTKTELLSRGMIAGDYVDQFLFHFFRRANVSVASYNNFQIRYATVDSTWLGWPVGPPTALAPATSAYVTLFGPSVVSLPMAMGSGGDYTITLNNKLYWNGNSNLVVDICFDNSLVNVTGTTGPDQLCLTTVSPVAGYNEVMWFANTTVSNGCALGFPLQGGTIAASAQYRPNITFHYTRPFSKFPINITGNGSTTAGNWVNNGYFDAGYSKVTFSNPNLNQVISGANVSTFNDLILNKTGAAGTNKLILSSYVFVDSFLVLNSGILDLNKNILTVNNTKTNAVTRTSPAGILSESTNLPYGIIAKKINTQTGTHLYPFITSSGDYIPFTYTVTQGNVGTVSVATYKTNNSIQPFPLNVNNIDDSLENNDAAYTVHRFWVLNKTGPGGHANLKFSYKNGEAPAPITKSNLKPNRYAYNTNLWKRFTNAVTTTIGASVSSVTIYGLSGNGLSTSSWALSDASSPLRIQNDMQPFATAFPNPFNKSFKVDWKGNEIFDLFIYDVSGRTVYENRNVQAADEINPGMQLIPGIYLVELKSTDRVEQFRMIKTE